MRLPLFGSEESWIAKPVPFETEWVLRALYCFTADQLEETFRALAALSNAHFKLQLPSCFPLAP
jgi:hypothetical protein